MNEHRDPVERTLELLVYAPLGVGLMLHDMAPGVLDMLVARGRAEVDRRHEEVQQRVTTARSMGEVIVAFGVPMVRDRVVGRVTGHDPAVEPELTPIAAVPDIVEEPEPEVARAPEPEPQLEPVPAEPPVPVAAPEPEPAPAPPVHFSWSPAITSVPTNGSTVGAPASAPTSAPTSDELPIPGYDALSASQVVERLIGLRHDELDAVHAYEAAHRQRRTILGKIEQLAGLTG